MKHQIKVLIAHPSTVLMPPDPGRIKQKPGNNFFTLLYRFMIIRHIKKIAKGVEIKYTSW